MFGMSMSEMAILLVIGILLFGSRLPEVARSAGGMYRRFRESLNDLQSQVQIDLDEPPSGQRGGHASLGVEPVYEESYEEVSVPKFEPPPDSD